MSIETLIIIAIVFGIALVVAGAVGVYVNRNGRDVYIFNESQLSNLSLFGDDDDGDGYWNNYPI